MQIRERLSAALDDAVRPDVFLLGKKRLAFQVCGYTGLALAIMLAMALALRRGLSPWVMAGVVLSAVASFFALAMATKIVTGRENLVYYYHEIAAIVFAAGFLWLARQPVLAYLDVTILGIGTFLVCGRIGCLMVGCCHGRPHRWGVRYRHEHAAAGFPAYLVGVRLFPIQLVESAWVLGIVAVGGALVWQGQPPGAALAWYVVMYDLGRFCFEFMRGDPARPYFRGFSEAQWISVFLMGSVIAAEAMGILPFQAWHVAVLAGLGLAMVSVVVRRRFRRTFQLLHPRHVREVAAALEETPTATDIRVGRTSLGIQISSGKIKNGSDVIYHYALSGEGGNLSPDGVRALAGLIVQLKHPSSRTELVPGNGGVFHVLVHSGL